MEADIKDIDKHRNFMREALREVWEPFSGHHSTLY